MIELTKAEEQIMQQLWRNSPVFVKDILAQLPDPKPAYNTVSTIVRILEKKGAVGYEAFGRSHRYMPLITEQAYRKQSISNLIGKFFNNSYAGLVSHLLEEEKLSLQELDELLKYKNDEDSTD